VVLTELSSNGHSTGTRGTKVLQILHCWTSKWLGLFFKPSGEHTSK